MTDTGISIMGLQPHNRNRADLCFGVAVGRALERRHPVHAAKMIARELTNASGVECSIRTAENILAGHLSNKTLTRLVDTYGLGLLLEAAGIRVGLGADEVLESFIVENAEKARAERAAATEKWRRRATLVGILRENKTVGAPIADRKLA